MLLLEKEGKLSIDDDIRKHLNYLPDFGHKINIRHLIHHTSGLRDQWQLLANAGWQLDDVITQEHIIKLVSKQKALNFLPGEEYMYCNTGYTLMAEIVKKVSGLSLREYADKNIFQPLGMNDTHFHDNYREIVPRRAYSYSPVDKGFQHEVLSYSTVGATSLFTTVLDEAKWLNNYETGKVGGKDLIEKMYQTGILNDGRKLNYAFAINMGKHRGWQQIGHGGGDAGFRTYACRFPEKGIGIVVFSNHGWTNPSGLTNQVADVLIPDEKKEETSKNEIKDSVNSAFLKRLQGKYYTDRGNRVELVFANGKIQGRNTSGGSFDINISSEAPGRYRIEGEGTLVLEEKNASTDSIMQFKLIYPNNTLTWKRQPKTQPKITSEFAGRYYGEETESNYYVTEKEGKLNLEHRKYSTVALSYIAPDLFSTPHWWMSSIHFLRDSKGKIVAFEVNSGRVQHLRYDKK